MAHLERKEQKIANIPMAGLLGEGLAVVVGLPSHFDLCKKLSGCTCIKMATAFAHKSGWQLISHPVLACKGEIQIMAGLHFFQTEPPLLDTWLEESNRSGKFECKVVRKANRASWIFHPKVLIVKGADGKDFAIVGSGNLSAGGLRDNIECSLYTDDQATVCDLVRWFDDVYEKFAEELKEPLIRWYRPRYKKYQKRSRKLARDQFKELRQLDQQIGEQPGARLKSWQQAVEDARKLFADPTFIQQWKECVAAAKNIRKCLDYPRFDFEYDQWQKFLEIPQFGNLRALNLYRRTLIRNVAGIRTAFRILTDKSKDDHSRLQSVVSGRAKVKGIALNVITKVLMVHDRKRWPVYNSRVRGVLKKYGYEVTRGLSKADKYLAYAKLMRQFAQDTGARDMYALDRFFLDVSQQSARVGKQLK